MNIPEARETAGVGSFTVAVPRLGWPAEGMVVDNARAAIACTGNYSDIKHARFSSWSYEQFHYCPIASWADWVDLAKRILAADAAITDAVRPRSRREAMSDIPSKLETVALPSQCGPCDAKLDTIKRRDAEIERLQTEVESKSEQIGKLYKVCNERDVLLNTLKGIAEYCSTDHGTLGAIARLASIRNTADRAVATYQQRAPEKS